MSRVSASLFAFLLAAGCASESNLGSPKYPLPVHSDLPLFGVDADGSKLWPNSFVTADGFGCKNLFSFGDWKETYSQADSGSVEDATWWRITNGGIMHCAAIFSQADTRDQTAGVTEGGYTVDLGDDPKTGMKLYAFQIGVRPGSTYTLLAAEPGKALNAFLVLHPVCPRAFIRNEGRIGIALTAYCAAPNRSTLLAMAHAALARPPLARLEYVGPTPDDNKN